MVFTFVLCPHTTTPLDLLPWKMKKNQVYQSHKVTWCLCCLFVVHLAFPSFFFAVRRLAGPQFPHRLLSARVGSTTTHPSLTQHNSTSTGKLISLILIIRTSISFTRKSAGSPASLVSRPRKQNVSKSTSHNSYPQQYMTLLEQQKITNDEAGFLWI